MLIGTHMKADKADAYEVFVGRWKTEILGLLSVRMYYRNVYEPDDGIK
jgi:hypothetical protein